MEYRFTISENDYLEALTEQLKNRRKGILNILAFLIMTVGQSGFALWHILTQKPEADTAVLMAALSAIVFVMQIFYQFSLKQRASHILQREKRTGKISENFWKKQTLKLEDDVLTLNCGKSRLAYDCAYFSKQESLGQFMVLTFRRERQIQQIILPQSIFKTAEEKQEFIDRLHSSQQNSIRSGVPGIDEQKHEGGECSVRYSMSRADFARALMRGTRRSYLTKAGMSLKNIARLAGAAFLLGNAIAGTINTAGYAVYAALISLILLFPFIVAFSPLEKAVSKESAEKIFFGLDSMEFCLTVFEENLVWQGESFINEMPISNIVATEKDKYGFYLYLSDKSFLIVPLDGETGNEATKCWLYLETVARCNSKKRSNR